ncbi:TonB-dependent receptor [Saccharophagus degradans]|uniref:TonB-dependent receptor n=1 Tax=Saccharophagus degradans TaxID=86304 RepID=A0AAW7X268_9GAMM|nr:TonB-dependent receptor [Saccharophagus degradans]MDO6421821.1 TonB-dependent receptor [Saccharophagus degradans]MDO6606485.1 TonB-dependent receptor [Saccharophagus degradans]
MTNKYTIGAFALSAFTLAFNQAVYAQEDQAGLEEVVVTGIRQSLQAAADIKRNESRIVDAIVAEDIGKLPDNNIAEALQRITGVSINTDFGVGESVSIRGLSENRVELNGRSTMGDGRDGVSLDDFPSSFLKTVEVIKSPTADMIEGALGGTVSMKTVRPLELKGLTAAGALDFEYADKTEHWAPIFNGSVGNNWDLGDAGTFGAIAMVSYQDRELRQDEFFNRVKLYDIDAGGAGAEGAGNNPAGRYAIRDQNTVEQYVEKRERTATNLSLQWAPSSESGSFYLDWATTKRAGSQAGVSILDVTHGTTEYLFDGESTQDGGGQVNNYDTTNVFVIPKTKSSFRETESSTWAIGGEWTFSENVLVSGEISDGSSESSEPATELNLRPISRATYELDGSSVEHRATVAFEQNGDKLPSIVYSDSGLLTNPDNLAIREFLHDDVITTNDEKAARLDVEVSDTFDWLPSIKAGVRLTKGEYNYDQSRFRIQNLHKDTWEADDPTTRRIVWIDDFEDMFPGSMRTVSYNNSFNQTGLSGQNDLLTYRVYDPASLHDADAAFIKIQQMLVGTDDAITGSLDDNLSRQTGSFRDITEDTSAMYVSADLDFDVVSATAGVRYIKTEVTSSVYSSDDELVTGTNEYSDVLPSLNVTYTLQDDTLIRFAAAKVMRRPGYTDLSSAFDIDNSIVTASRGALSLNPHRATQFDLSVEHYFGDANMVSAAVFYKDVQSFLDSSTTCVASSLTSGQNVTEYTNVCLLDAVGVDNSDLEYATDAQGLAFVEGQRDAGLTGIRTSQTTNGENGKVQGFELGYQHMFDFLPGAWSGLGVGANYTYADSENPNGNTLMNISKNTLNTQVYWEYEEFQVRFAYNFRDKYLSSEEEKRVETIGALGHNSTTNDSEDPLFDPTAGNNYRDDRGQLDFSASWDVNDSVTLAANVSNLLGAPSSFSTELGSKWMYTEADRRFTFGVRAKF